MTFFIPSLLKTAVILAGLSGCPDGGMPEVHVNLNASDPPLDTSMTKADLTATFANNPDSTLSTEPGWSLGGVTHSNLQVSFRSQFKMEPIAPGEGCVYVTKVDVDITYNPVIYIASDFLHNQCQYELTMAHEQRHVAADLETFNDYTPILQQRVQEYIMSLGPQGPYAINQLNEVGNQTSQQIMDDAQPITEELKETRRQRQAVFDTKENYMAENSLCEGQ